MPVKFSIEDKIELVLIEIYNYKTCKQITEIFSNRHPDRTVHFTTVRYIINESNMPRSVQNKFRRKHRNEKIENDVMSTMVEPQKFHFENDVMLTVVKFQTIHFENDRIY